MLNEEKNEKMVGSMTENDWHELMVDGGSQVHVCRREFGDHFNMYPKESQMRDVQGAIIPHHGQRKIGLMMEGGQRCLVNFQVGDVVGNILSMRRLVKAGVIFKFDEHDAWMERSGVRVPLHCKNGLYYLRVKLLGKKPQRPDLVAPVVEGGGVDLRPFEQDEEEDQDRRQLELDDQMLMPFDQDHEEEVAEQERRQDEEVAEQERQHLEKIEGEEHRDAGPVRRLPRPADVSEEQVREHALTHLPPQRWCEVCVGGRGQDAGHVRGDLDGRQDGVVQFDYCFATENVQLTKDETAGRITILVARDMDSGCPLATVVRSKGGKDAFTVEVAARFVNSLGLTKATLQCDDEPAIKDLLNKVAAKTFVNASVRVSPRGSHASNGGAEQMVQIIMGGVRVWIMDLEKKTGIKLRIDHPVIPWLVRHVAWLEARFRHSGVHKQSAYERIQGRPYKSALAIFGETLMARMPFPNAVSKLDPRFVKGIFLGKSESSDEFIIGDESGRVFTTRTVRMINKENKFDGVMLMKLATPPWGLRGGGPEATPGPALASMPLPVEVSAGPEVAAEAPGGAVSSGGATSSASSSRDDAAMGGDERRGQVRGREEGGERQPGSRPRRELTPKRTSVEAGHDDEGDAVRRRVQTLTQEEIQESIMKKVLVENHVMTAMEDLQDHLNEISPEMRRAGREVELRRLREFKVYTPVRRRPGMKVIGTRWVEVRKGDEARCRFVAKDFAWTKREDLYAATPAENARWLVDILAAKLHLPTITADVSVAFLHAPAVEEIYVIPPDEFFEEFLDQLGGDRKDWIWRLDRQLYGCRGAPKAWQEHLVDLLRGQGLRRSRCNPTMFMKKCHGGPLVIDIHVDDFHGVGPAEDLLNIFVELRKHLLLKTSELFKKGDSYEHLKLKRVRREEGTYLCPTTKYVDDCLSLLGLEKCSPAPTPGRHVTKNLVDEYQEKLDMGTATIFRSCVGKLLFLSGQRYDIQWAIGSLCREIKEPTKGGMNSLKRLCRYLAGTREAVVFISSSGGLDAIEVFVDASWASCVLTRKSVGSGIVRIGGSPIYFWSRTQHCVSQSSGESEFYAIVEGLNEGIGLAQLIGEVGYNLEVRVLTDSAAGRAVLYRLGSGQRLRHVEVRWFHAQDLIQRGLASVMKIPGDRNPADLGTKAVTKETLMKLLPLAGIHEKLQDKSVMSIDAKEGNFDLKSLQRALSALIVLQQATMVNGAEELANQTVHTYVETKFIYVAVLIFGVGLIMGVMIIIVAWRIFGEKTKEKSDEDDETYIYMSENGEKYHKVKDCKSLKKAIKVNKYGPCKICKPKLA